jgi:transposase
MSRGSSGPSVDGMKEVRGSNPVSSTNAKQGRRWLAVKLRLRLLLKEREPSKIRWRLADFYDAAIDAQTLEITRPPQTIRDLWPAIVVALTPDVSNARTEGFNRVIKQTKRVGCG